MSKPPSKPKGTPRVRQARPVDPVSGESGLTASEEHFAMLVATGASKTGAYLQAFPHTAAWKAATRNNEGWKLSVRHDVATRISELVAEAARQSQLTVNRVLAEIEAVALGDVRELINHTRRCCRCCWGPAYRAMPTEGEWLAEHAKQEDHRRAMALKSLGDPGELQRPGAWFDEAAEPHPGCPACGGRGVLRVVVADLADLTPQARALYAGVKQTRDGLEIKVNDKMGALTMAAKHLDIYTDSEAPVTEAPNLEALEAIFAAALAKADADKAAAFERKRLLDEGTG